MFWNCLGEAIFSHTDTCMVWNAIQAAPLFLFYDVVLELPHNATKITKSYTIEVVFKNLTNLDLYDNISYYVINYGTHIK